MKIVSSNQWKFGGLNVNLFIQIAFSLADN